MAEVSGIEWAPKEERRKLLRGLRKAIDDGR